MGYTCPEQAPSQIRFGANLGWAAMQSDHDNNLQSYFTYMERPRDMFMNFVSAEKLPKRLLVFHGISGVVEQFDHALTQTTPGGVQ